jgi:hypothetical protein
LKLAPYSKPLLKKVSRNKPPEQFIFLWVGDYALENAERLCVSLPDRTLMLPITSSLPSWLCPFDYIWPVKSCRILIVDTSGIKGESIQELVYWLYENGAVDVRYLSPDLNLVIYKKG